MADEHPSTLSLRGTPAENGVSLPQVPGYQILRELGRGSMGVVYLARHQGLNRQVALKMILIGAHADPGLITRFYVETQTVAKLQHPGIVQVFDSGWCNGLPYCALELLTGGTLDDRLEGAAWAARPAAELVLALARTMHAAHQAGVVHRDLKPANILFDAEGRPKIADFGIAKDLQNPDGGYTQSGDIIGTPHYMAPEQAGGGSKTVGPAADIYALGVLLYELLTGEIPFNGKDAVEVLIQVRTVEPLPPRRRVAGVPADLDVICMKCLEKEPGRRYPSAQALADDLQAFLEDRPIQARRVGDLERLRRWGRRNPLVAGLLLAIAGLFLVAFVLVSLSYWRVEQALSEARLREKEERWARYRAHLATGAAGLEMHNVGVVRQALSEAPEEHRNWEWRYFWNALDRSTRTHSVEDVAGDVLRTPSGQHVLIHLTGKGVRVCQTNPLREILAYDDVNDEKITLSPDGRYLAISGLQQELTLFSIPTRTIHQVLPVHAGPVQGKLFSPDGRLLVTTAAKGPAYLWDVATGTKLHTFPLADDGYRLLDYSEDGRRIAVLVVQANRVEIWNPVTGAVDQSWSMGDFIVRNACFDHAGERLLLKSSYPVSDMQLWETGTGKHLTTLRGHENQISSVAFSPDDQRVATGSFDQTIRLWDLPSGNLRARLEGHRGWVQGLAFHPSGDLLVSASQDRTVRMWNGHTGAPLSILHGHTDEIYLATFVAGGSRIVTGGRDGTLREWDTAVVERGGVLRGHKNFAYDVAFHPNGEEVASAAWDGTVRLWNATSTREVRQFRHPYQLVTAVAFSPDGRHLVSRARDNTVRFWNVASGEVEQTWTVPTNDWRDCRLAFDSAGRLLATGGMDQTVRLWDRVAGREVAVLPVQGITLRDVAFSPDNRWLVAVGDSKDFTLVVWDVAARTERHRIKAHALAVLSVAFHPTRDLMASGSADGTIRLWDTQTWQEIGRLKQGTTVYDLAFSPDGTRLVCACADNTIRLWDVASGKEVAELRGHGKYVHAVQFSPDGSRLASASGDHTVRIWETLGAAERAARRR